MHNLRWLSVLMGIAILGITGFQAYWLKNNYEREKQALRIKTGAGFHQALLKLQSSKMKLDRFNLQIDSLTNSIKPAAMLKPAFTPAKPTHTKPPKITMMNLLQEKMREGASDTGKAKTFVFSSTEGFTRELTVDSTGKRGAMSEKALAFTTGYLQAERMRNADTAKDAGGERRITISYDTRFGAPTDSQGNNELLIRQTLPPGFAPSPKEHHRDAVIRFLYNVDSLSLKDSVTLKEITGVFANRLKEEKMSGLSFSISRSDSASDGDEQSNEVTIGLASPVTYRLELRNEFAFLVRQIRLPILFSIFLVGITIATFILLYRNLVRQKRLAEQKNQFISNITHELKTPIATVGVAIEALQNFNALHDPRKTKEYLDISRGELQRLGLLVDKVLKLSMFEKKEIELKKEPFDARELVEEVMNSMKLQFEKYHAKVKLRTEGSQFIIEADKLHITSVIYNLLDNALKYSRDHPAIEVTLSSTPEAVEFTVADNGIGIEPAYREKIFDKFFRVPTGDLHNIKGYGLGLSYVAEVMHRHRGAVYVQSEVGQGSTFTAKLPLT